MTTQISCSMNWVWVTPTIRLKIKTDKTPMRKLVLLLVLGLGFFAAQAQTPTASTKVGFADIEYIMGQMPEAKQIESELKTTETMLKNQIQSKAQEFQKKVADYN